jgi:hypothetical protein
MKYLNATVVLLVFEDIFTLLPAQFGVVSRLRRAKSKALALHIKNGMWKARAFPPSADGQVLALT